MTVFRYTKGAVTSVLEGIDLTWPQPDGDPYDFSTGWTFTALIGTPNSPALVEITDDFTGAATYPNLRLNPDAGDLDPLPVGTYHLDITGTITATGQPITRTWLLQILPGVQAVD
jgi:hypothetical protein